jgi:hypothetical protein
VQRPIIILCASVGLAACGGNEPAQNNAAATAAAPARKHPTYCFFKDSQTKGWTASRAADGSVTVRGQVHLPDRRYMASLGDLDIAGTNAQLWLTMPPNNTGMGAQGDMWDIKTSVPASDAATIDKVTVMCGKKTVAELPLKKA